MPEIIWGGVMASPFIGVGVGCIYRRAFHGTSTTRLDTALLMLYVAVGAFGLAAGVYDATVRDIPSRDPFGVVVQAALATMGGITMTGLVLLLWPLSYLNQCILYRMLRTA